MPRRRTALAWKNLTHEPRRLAVAVAGVAFAVVLMFMQLGFESALFESNVQVIRGLDADILIFNRAQFALPAQQRFSRQRIIQAASCQGVKGAWPLYSERVAGVLSAPGDAKVKGNPIRVLAYHLGDPIFSEEEIKRQEPALRGPATALIDSKGKRGAFGAPVDDLQKLRRHDAELAGKTVRLVGVFQLGIDFSHQGNMIMSDRNFAQYFAYRGEGGDPLGVVDLGLVQVEDDWDPRVVRDCIAAVLPADVYVKTKDEFIDREKRFWRTATPIGKIFFMGVLIGFIVGTAICYQIIYSNVSDYLPEFATLRAMGYTNRYFVGVVLSLSFYLSLLGFVPGYLISEGAYLAIRELLGLSIGFDPLRLLTVFCLTLSMCVLSGAFAMRKVLSVDPAELY